MNENGKFNPPEEMAVTEQGVEAAMLEVAERIEADPDLAFLREFQESNPLTNVYLIGGIVRDCAMGLPCNDFDFVIEGSDKSVVEKYLLTKGKIVAESDRKTAVYKFVPEGSDTAYDIALARIEEYDSASRKPSVVTEGVSIEQDLSRRDFTINAMALPAFKNAAIIDPYGGLQDLNSHLIRAVGEPEARFMEDPLRMLRAIRFSCRFGFDIDSCTFGAIQKKAAEINSTREIEGKIVRKVSGEMLRKELTGALMANPPLFFDLMIQSRLMSEVLPEVDALGGIPQPPVFHSEGDVSCHTRLALASLGPNSNVATTWATLLHDIGKKDTYQSASETGDRIRFNGHEKKSEELANNIFERLHFKKEIKREMGWLIRNHMMLPAGFQGMKLSRKKNFVQEKYFDDLVNLTVADAKASIPENGEPNLSFLKNIDEVRQALAQDAAEQRPQKIIDGNKAKELIASDWPEFALHKEYGPYIGEILRKVNEAYQDGEIKTREEAEQMARKCIAVLRSSSK